MRAIRTNNNIIIQYAISLCLMVIIILYPQVAYARCHDGAGFSYLLTGLIFLLPVLAIALCIPRKWLYCIIVVLCTISSIIELTMVDLFSGYLQPGGILSTIMTNPQEASEFYDTNLHEVWNWIPLIVLCIASCWCYNRVNIRIWKYGIALSFVLIPVLFITYKLTISYRKDPITLWFYLDNRVWNRPPYNVVYASNGAYRIFEQRKMIEQAANVNFGAHRDSIPANKEIYVLGIGESMRYENLSLNGHYPRTTTPRLEALNNIILFDNYYSQACITMFSAPMLITRATPTNFELNYAERSIIEPFRECGFATYVIANNNLLTYEKYLSNGCDSLFAFYNEVENGEIKLGDKTIVHIIDSLSQKHDKLFVLCQFMGNHAFYTNYEKEFDIYHPNMNDPYGDKSEESVTNAYDNTVLYADYILSSIISAINADSALAAFMFVSDHGECIGEGGGGHGGNCAPVKDEYHVPFIFWCSDSYANLNPQLVQYATQNSHAKLSGDNIFYSVCGMANIVLDSLYAEPTYNVLSPQFQEHTRLVLLPDGVSTINPDK